MKKIISLLVMGLAVSSIYAGGYRVALQGQRGLAMGHSGVAIIDSAELAFFNPSGLVFLENKLNISAGVTPVFANVKYQNLETRETAETDNSIGTPFYAYVTYGINDWLSVGLSVFTPYGSAVDWPTDWPGSHLVNSISLQSIFINPIVSLKLTPEFSIGGGPIFVTGNVEFNRNQDLTTSTIDGRANVDLEANNVTNWGWNISTTFRPSEAVTIGASYTSKIDLSAEDGDVEFTNLDFLPETGFNATLPLPAELTFGAAVQINKKLIVTAEFSRAYWAVYKSLDIEFTNPLIPTSFNARNYKNANTYRTGVQYDLNNKITLRGGYYFDETPVTPGFFAPETPRDESHGFTTGLSYNFNDRLAIDLSILYLHFDEITESFDSSPDDDIPPFEGTYLSSVITPGIGVSYKL